MISGVLFAGVFFLLDVGLAVFLLPRRDIITNLVVGAVGFFRYRKFYSAGRTDWRIAGVDFLAIFLVRVLLVEDLLITVGLCAADAHTAR